MASTVSRLAFSVTCHLNVVVAALSVTNTMAVMASYAASQNAT